MSKYTEADKVKEKFDEIRLLEEFLEFIRWDEGICFYENNPSGGYGISGIRIVDGHKMRKLLYSFLDLDYEQYDKERTQMLEDYRRQQEKP